MDDQKARVRRSKQTRSESKEEQARCEEEWASKRKEREQGGTGKKCARVRRSKQYRSRIRQARSESE